MVSLFPIQEREPQNHFVIWSLHKLMRVWLTEVESRTQGSRPGPRTQEKSEAKAKDSLSEDRNSRGQGQECSRPKTKDTSASALQKKKKGLHKNFSSDLQKKRFPENFSSAPQNFTNSKNSASSSRGQAIFRGLEASRPRTSKCVLEAKDVLEDSTSGG